MTVRVIHWNPRRHSIRGPIRYGPRIDNFGDLLGPVVVARLLEATNLRDTSRGRPRLLTVGSILHLGKDGDTVWGAGVNGKITSELYEWHSLDVRAVRGPLTADFLRTRGVSTPAVYGDPGLLIGHFWSREELSGESLARSHVILPNFHDYEATRAAYPNQTVNPRAPLWDVIGQIAAADFVAGSSLHGIVIAESLGIPARLVVSGAEPEFKYLDYFRGTGRDRTSAADDVDAALRAGGAPGLKWDADPLLAAFPKDLFSRRHRRDGRGSRASPAQL